MASGDHARQLQSEEKLPKGEGDENSGTDVEPLDLKEKMSVMKIDDKSQDLAAVVEEEGGAQALDSGDALTLKKDEDDVSPAQLLKELTQVPVEEAVSAQQPAFEEEYESIRSLLTNFGDSFEGLKALMERVKVAQAVQVVAGMETKKLLEEIDGIQLENIRSIVRLHHFFTAIVEMGKEALFPMDEPQSPDEKDDAVKRANELESDLAAIKEATTGIRCRVEAVKKAAGDRLEGKRQKVQDRLLKNEKSVADAEKYFEGFFKLVPNPQATQLDAKINLLFDGKVEGALQLHSLVAAIGDIF